MIYTITITNKKTNAEISRDYDFDKVSAVDSVIGDMINTLEDNKPKF